MQKTLCGSICRNAEGNRPFTLPSICSAEAIFWNDEKCVFPAEKKGGIDAVTKKQATYRIRAPTGKFITPTLKTEYRRAADT